MIQCLVSLLLFISSLLPSMTSASDAVASDTFERPIRIKQAKDLFDTRRYRDAEAELTKIRADHLPLVAQNLDSYLNVLDLLARSISQRGKTEGVLALLEERHVLIAQHYDSRGYVFASSMGRLAEAKYRAGNRNGALSFIDYAISLYEDLRPIPDEAISLARSNRLQYKVAQFNTAMLPMDLSDFYTRCELLKSAESTHNSAELMSAYIEVGVDYLPEGKWADYFDMLTRQQSSVQQIFLPHSSEPMRGDLCLVDRKSEQLISAESELE